MSIDIFKRILLFVIFCLVQSLILNHIHLFHCATPLLYVYFVAMFPRRYPKWGILLWSFMLGLVIDTFSNTPGVAAASLTLIGAIQPYFLELFVPRDSIDELVPSMRNLGITKYTYYIFVLVLLYCLVFYAIEMFNFANWLHWLECVGGSAILTIVLILTFESVGKK
ncbi:MAG: rod shape-determining protein MreD [Prevotella sp.]|nr:rod shape-determining protein MreD [Prevotella sp.]